MFLSFLSAKDEFSAGGAVFTVHFDTPLALEIGKGVLVERNGGTIVPDGMRGGVLRLLRDEYLGLDLRNDIRSKEGTLMLWIRPHWGYYATDQTNFPVSHTFVSMAWDNNAYFVLSDGWWEPEGAPYTYFVAHNQFRAHTHKDIRYVQDEWMLLSCNWKQGNSGFVRLYENTSMVAESLTFNGSSIRPKGLLYLGCDKGTSPRKDRWADCDIANLAIFTRALDDTEISNLWNATRPMTLKNSVDVTVPSDSVSSQTRDDRGVILETRAIFDEGTEWMTKEGAQQTIARIKKAGFNVYIPCVWHGRGARYPAKLAPIDDKVTLTREDPLAHLIDIAHQNGIEVHPWFCVALRQRTFLGDYYTLFKTPYNAFDVHRPKFRAFISNVIEDVAWRYDIDGINLDFIRTMGLCKCHYCVQEYQRQFDRDLVADSTVNNLGHMEPHLQQWQDQAIEDIVRRISINVKRIKPGLVLSVDGHPRPRVLPPSWQGRREIKWANDGLIDIIFNMDYDRKPDFEKHALVLQELYHPNQLIMLLGNYDMISKKQGLPRDSRYFVQLVYSVLHRWPGGVGIYLYNQLDDAQIDALAQGPFKEKAEPLWTNCPSLVH